MVIENNQGSWGKKFDLSNVGIHLHLLPTGKVLYWGRRNDPKSPIFATLNEHKTHAFILDPSTTLSQPTSSEPVDMDGKPLNLFCSGHTFQPDGTLLVVGGHISDGRGLDQACVYNPFTDKWTAKPEMSGGRWYPSALTLPDGRALVVSGSNQDSAHINLVPQIWQSPKDQWLTLQSPTDIVFPLYPRLYNDPTGKVFVAGPLARSSFLDLTANGGHGAWSAAQVSPTREAGQREYAASVAYDVGKILYVGGGGGDSDPPTTIAEIIDLNDPKPQWKKTNNIGVARRHHFATMLPDGTVLVTGGTRGSKFNDLAKGQPVHMPELWNPATEQWTRLAEEDDDRCYHGTALLLPDGRVLSAGGGEYEPDNSKLPNAPKDSLTSAQFFSPPYMSKGDPPTVSKPPSDINYGQKFAITVGTHDVIDKVSWIRLGSVTHACNMNQSFQFLKFSSKGTEITIEGPTNPNVAPPGHYMLFVVNKAGRPGVAPIIRLNPLGAAPVAPKPAARMASQAALGQHLGVTLTMRDEKVKSEQERLPVIVGLTPACPYGLGPCWGGAYEALHHISEVETVRPMPIQEDSVAFVYLRDDVLPDIDEWRKELRLVDSGTYELRGIDITLSGVVTAADGQLTLAGTSTRPDLVLTPFQADSKIQWDNVKKEPKPISDEEASAYARISKTVAELPAGSTLQVSGRLQKHDAKKFSLDVRDFVVQDTTTATS